MRELNGHSVSEEFERLRGNVIGLVAGRIPWRARAGGSMEAMGSQRGDHWENDAIGAWPGSYSRSS